MRKLNTSVIGVCVYAHLSVCGQFWSTLLHTFFSWYVCSYKFDLILPIIAAGVWLCLSSLLPLAMSPARQRGGREFVREWRGGKVPVASCFRLNVIYCTLCSVLCSFCDFYVCGQIPMTFFKHVSSHLEQRTHLWTFVFCPRLSFKLLSSLLFFFSSDHRLSVPSNSRNNGDH